MRAEQVRALKVLMWKSKWWFFLSDVFYWIWRIRPDRKESLVMFHRCCKTSLWYMERAGMPASDVIRTRSNLEGLRRNTERFYEKQAELEAKLTTLDNPDNPDNPDSDESQK